MKSERHCLKGVDMCGLKVLLFIILAALPSCAGWCNKAPNAKRYAKIRNTYERICNDYSAELAMTNYTNASAVRRCALSHADETRRKLGGRSLVSGKFQRYSSYPLLEYVADLRTVITDLEHMSAQLMATGSSALMQQQAADMRSTAHMLCQCKAAIIDDPRYLQEQDKWDIAQQNKNNQAMVNLLVANSMAPQKVLHEVRVREMK